MKPNGLFALLIAGPTASGKSALAIRLAQELGGLVVNADSMQVYRDLRIITARPTLEEEAMVPHRLFGHVDGAVNYSVGKWVEDAKRQVAEITASGRLPIFAGGTGMYFKALLRGLSEIPAVPDTVRAEVRASAEGASPGELHARLATSDPLTAARLRPTDPQRILRALEVFAATGQPLASFHESRSAPILDPARCLAFFLAPERALVTDRIDRRFETMMEHGALDEVERLAARGLDPALPVMRAHGVPGLIAYLRGEETLAEAIARGQRDTRAYAKRQFTFIRHQLPEFRMVAPDGAWEAVRGAVSDHHAATLHPEGEGGRETAG
ncbi:MAG: tRNA ((37)-N6)-dimethylallyltransferase MiaA [Hyphomicrobiales bacterium]|nr:tRNA ((37)-N6)-dimethylallyltransferase MiaA [Hyphomicrobiales bacterium]